MVVALKAPLRQAPPRPRVLGTRSVAFGGAFLAWPYHAGVASFIQENGGVANPLDISDFENLHGGSGVDTFNISGTVTANLDGGSGNDVFVFADGAALTGTLDGLLAKMADFTPATTVGQIGAKDL